ncbi:MAG: hypothetical protein A3K19_07480 [Lentisphaerae bacterium RIFOXYB12_FULL_65_16]|nr:MAG: hypothetical protein A3K18_21685 [Lentisphaerae bacterium RIFOXYA12_64_32]OGV93381.1 MAG: hypothetical protein A3K19_07480 [Lentisphaerae bacterium RIFOXYB12_FULL_65_16]
MCTEAWPSETRRRILKQPWRNSPIPCIAAPFGLCSAAWPLSGTQTAAGQSCDCGHTVIAVDGGGTVRRCHFVPEPLGNLYDDGLANLLRLRPCPNATCWCHIGYVHLHALPLREQFSSGILERIPVF